MIEIILKGQIIIAFIVFLSVVNVFFGRLNEDERKIKVFKKIGIVAYILLITLFLIYKLLIVIV